MRGISWEYVENTRLHSTPIHVDGPTRHQVDLVARLCGRETSLKVEVHPTSLEVWTDASKSHGGLSNADGSYCASVKFAGKLFNKCALRMSEAKKGTIPIYLLELYVVLVAVTHCPR